MKKVFIATILMVFFCLISIGFSSDIDALVKDLGNKEKAKDASVELAKIGKPAVPALIKALEDNDKNRKRYAARALREMGEDASDAIPALSKAIKDSDSQTREYVVEALGNMVNEAEQVIPVLKKATKDSDNDVKKKAKEAVKKLQSSSSDQTDEKGRSENSSTSSAQKVLRDSVPLDKGIYGVPFNATVEEVLVWVKDNNMAIDNPTEQAITKNIKERHEKIERLKNEAKDYEDQKQNMPAMEQEAQEVTNNIQGFDPTVVGIGLTAMQNIEAIEKNTELLKNPSISYAGEKYYLIGNFSDGMNAGTIDGKTCKDPEITQNSYKLVLEPTKESERTKKDNLGVMAIYFYINEDQQMRSYATYAVFNSEAFKDIYKTITDKYGEPVLPKYTKSNERKYNEDWKIIEDERFHVTGFTKTPEMIWARNIQFSGNINVEDDRSISSSVFGLLYYDPNIVNQLIEHHKKAIEKFNEEQKKQRNQEVNQIKKDF